MKLPRELRGVLEAARQRGWTITQTNNSHLRLTHPHGALLFCPTTPSDGWHGIKNLKADLKRAERVGR